MLLYNANNVAKALDTKALHLLGQCLDNLLCGIGVLEVGGTHLHGCSTRHHHLDDVRCRAYATATHNGDVAGVGHLLYHAHSNGEDSVARETAHLVGDNWLATHGVDAHAEQCVNQTDAISSCLLARACYSHDVRYVGAEFDEYGLLCHSLYATRNLCCRLWLCAEAHTAIVHIGARYVNLDNLHLLLFVDLCAALLVLLQREATDVGYDGIVENLAKMG